MPPYKIPKRVKHRKEFRRRRDRKATKGNYVAFGEFGLQLLCRIVEQFDDFDLATVTCRVGTLEDIGQEPGELLGVLQCQFFRVAFGFDLFQRFGGLYFGSGGTRGFRLSFLRILLSVQFGIAFRLAGSDDEAVWA